ncbi:MAG: hypothetical protein ACRDZ3_13810 [Acidimicrobiia bacterium]
MPAKLNGGVVNITTPYGLARVNSSGRVLWAEWEVWRHSADLVGAGVWSSSQLVVRGRARLVYFVVGEIEPADGIAVPGSG